MLGTHKEWYNPHDPDAKVGRTKDGACDMIHKPEHIVDLKSGAVIAAKVRFGDAGDTEDLPPASSKPWSWWRKFMVRTTWRESPAC